MYIAHIDSSSIFDIFYSNAGTLLTFLVSKYKSSSNQIDKSESK